MNNKAVSRLSEILRVHVIHFDICRNFFFTFCICRLKFLSLFCLCRPLLFRMHLALCRVCVMVDPAIVNKNSHRWSHYWKIGLPALTTVGISSETCDKHFLQETHKLDFLLNRRLSLTLNCDIFRHQEISLRHLCHFSTISKNPLP